MSKNSTDRAIEDLRKMVKNIEHGTITPSLTVFNGKVSSIQGNRCKKRYYAPDENDLAIGEMLAEIKRLHDEEIDGNFTVTLTLQEGNIRWLYFQKNLKYEYGRQGDEQS